MEKQEKRQRRTCDIVMKGGITSGVVYPQAIVKLATRFTFKNIGGTSAGAIAAAVAAAAEFQRLRTGSEQGFKEIAGLGDLLGKGVADGEKSMLFSLFAPNVNTKKVFDVLTSPLGLETTAEKIRAVIFRTIGSYKFRFLAGLLPGILLAAISAHSYPYSPLGWLWAVIGTLIALISGLAVVFGTLAYEFVTTIPKNDFGICNGMPDSQETSKGVAEPLTVWLSKYLNDVAGIQGDNPLIFGDLWGPGGVDRIEFRQINLEMMTTNLTHGRPYRMPFRNDDDLRENYQFYFREDDFERLFPSNVVKWMIDHPRQIVSGNNKDDERAADRAKRKDDGYYPLPDPENLPVIVATRMSLSFPVLLSVIPLYVVDYSKGKEKETMKRCWFTDGGVCSNFPIHFFDSPLPRRPTFSIDLTTAPDNTEIDDLLPYMDDENGFRLFDQWNHFDKKTFTNQKEKSIDIDKDNIGKLTGFVGALISTMQNWNDATQGRLPGFRDRIARIPLTSKLGGLNLSMPDKLVTFLGTRGDLCADKIIERFDVPANHKVITWDNHRWIRLRSMLSSFETMIDSTLLACDEPENGDLGYEDWLQSLLSNPRNAPSYHPTKKQVEAAIETIEKLREIQQVWQKSNPAALRAPRPRPILRPRPQI